jgi:hypothetical protein
MERTMWSDERLDDRFNNLDRTLEWVHQDIREVRADIGALRLAILRVGGGLGIGLVGVIASILVSGG